MSMLNSRSETKAGLWESYKKYFNKVIPIGSIAYKLALVSTSQSDDAGIGSFEYDVPAGYYAICTTNLGDQS